MKPQKQYFISDTDYNLTDSILSYVTSNDRGKKELVFDKPSSENFIGIYVRFIDNSEDVVSWRQLRYNKLPNRIK